jgi:hypothetical protein
MSEMFLLKKKSCCANMNNGSRNNNKKRVKSITLWFAVVFRVSGGGRWAMSVAILWPIYVIVKPWFAAICRVSRGREGALQISFMFRSPLVTLRGNYSDERASTKKGLDGGGSTIKLYKNSVDRQLLPLLSHEAPVRYSRLTLCS